MAKLQYNWVHQNARLAHQYFYAARGAGRRSRTLIDSGIYSGIDSGARRRRHFE